MAHLLGISGSLRRASYNAMLLAAASELVPEGSTIEIASIRDIPLYDGDVEAAGIPEPVKALKDKIASADGVLLVTPEYNNGVPGVFKNAVDWTTRPPKDLPRVWGGRPVAIIGATTGAGGTNLAQVAWLQTLRHIGAAPWFGDRLLVKDASKVFDAGGKIVDATTRDRLAAFVKGFCEYADRYPR